MISVYFIISNILFVATNILIFVLPRPAKIQTIIPIVVVTALVEIIFFIKHFLTKKRSASTISAFVYALLIVWIAATRFGLSHPVLVPFPENVFNIFVTNRKDLMNAGKTIVVIVPDSGERYLSSDLYE